MDSDNVFMGVLGAVVISLAAVLLLVYRNSCMHDEKMAELGYQQVIENGATLWKKAP